MKRIRNQMPTILLFALPSFWPLVVLFLVLAIWKKGFIPDLIPVTIVTVAIITAAVFLAKGYGRISLPMMALGLYIALQQDQHFGLIFCFFGIYMMLHYAACGVHILINKKKGEESEHKMDFAMAAIACLPMLFAFSILVWC